jgi:hypothetical protein
MTRRTWLGFPGAYRRSRHENGAAVGDFKFAEFLKSALVNAPFHDRNNSLSSKPLGIAAQLIAINRLFTTMLCS